MSESIFVFIESLPSEVTISVILIVVLCFCCCIKDFLICCWRERRASNRMRRLQRLKNDAEEIEIIRSLESSISRDRRPPPPPKKSRDTVGALV